MTLNLLSFLNSILKLRSTSDPTGSSSKKLNMKSLPLTTLLNWLNTKKRRWIEARSVSTGRTSLLEKKRRSKRRKGNWKKNKK